MYDEIVDIVEMEEDELIDIQVSDDHLFYANGILTKNSLGVPATADFMAIIGRDPDDMIYQSEVHYKIVKNRLGGRVGDTAKMYYDARSLKMYDESEMELWLSDATKSNDERDLYEKEEPRGRSR